MNSLRIFEEVKARKPKRNPVFTAIEELKDPAEMRCFLQGYISWLVAQGKSLDEAERLCHANVGYILGYYEPEVVERWFALSEKIAHPIFGRKLNSVSSEEAYDAGIQEGRK